MVYDRRPDKRHVLADRAEIVPDDVPEDWIICNAPRPLYGDREFNGPFLSGVLYVAVDPTGDQAAFCLHRNAELCGVELVFHTEDDLIETALEWYRVNYAEAQIDVTDKDHRGMLVRRALDTLNGRD